MPCILKCFTFCNALIFNRYYCYAEDAQAKDDTWRTKDQGVGLCCHPVSSGERTQAVKSSLSTSTHQLSNVVSINYQ